MARDTSTGHTFELMVKPALKRSTYSFEPQKVIGKKPSGSQFKVDYYVWNKDRKVLISKKWQTSGGTAEEKIPFEIIMLKYAVTSLGYDFAYLVLGGTDKNSEHQQNGWTLRQWYFSGGLEPYINYSDSVRILGIEELVSLIHRGNL